MKELIIYLYFTQRIQGVRGGGDEEEEEEEEGKSVVGIPLQGQTAFPQRKINTID